MPLRVFYIFIYGAVLVALLGGTLRGLPTSLGFLTLYVGFILYLRGTGLSRILKKVEATPVQSQLHPALYQSVQWLCSHQKITPPKIFACEKNHLDIAWIGFSRKNTCLILSRKVLTELDRTKTFQMLELALEEYHSKLYLERTWGCALYSTPLWMFLKKQFGLFEWAALWVERAYTQDSWIIFDWKKVSEKAEFRLPLKRGFNFLPEKAWPIEVRSLFWSHYLKP